MRDGDDGAFVFLQMMFQPGDRFGVQMVGGLVQKQNVGLLQKQAAQGHTAALAAGKNFHGRVAGRAAQRVHRHFKPRIDVPGIQRVHFILQLGLALTELGHLVIGHFFGEFFVDRVVLIDHRHRFADAFLDDLPDGP